MNLSPSQAAPVPRSVERDAWLKQTLMHSDFTVDAASADASFRSYWRVRARHRSLILMDAPTEKEDCGPFIAIGEQLRASGLHAPQIVAKNQDQGFLLLEDLGDTLYSVGLTDATADSLYSDAMAALAQMQQLDHSQLPAYDETLLRYELSLFHDWLLERHLGYVGDAQFQQRWQALTDVLVDNALSQPTVFVHRDYHSRNLLVVDSNNPGIIDFQDAVAGPITYDLVSLLRDCYVRWPRSRVNAWTQQYRQRAHAAGLTQANQSTWHRWFDLMGLQRHLKAAGIFCRLNQRDGKPGYLPDIPRTLAYVIETCADDPQLSWFASFISDRVIPQFGSGQQ